MNSSVLLAMLLAGPPPCQYDVNYGLQAHKLVNGAWLTIGQGTFVQPGVPVRFHGWVAVGPNGCDACCAEISFRLTSAEPCGDPSTHEWQRIGTLGTLSAGERWEWTSRSFIPDSYVVYGYFLINGVQSAGQTQTYGPSRAFYVLCTGDATGDLNVDIDDLLVVINNWGDPGGCGDDDHNAIVNVADLLLVIDNWGSCY